MPLTQIDPVAALIVIDMQKGIVGMPVAHPAAEIAARVAQLARAFREKKFPVVLVNVAGQPTVRTDVKRNFNPPPDWTDLIPELDRQPSDYTVTKMQFGAFYGTALEMILRRRGVTQIILCGISTTIGVESTARAAYDHGYNVVFAIDAMTDMSAENHKHSVEKVFPRLGESATTDEVVARL